MTLPAHLVAASVLAAMARYEAKADAAGRPKPANPVRRPDLSATPIAEDVVRIELAQVRRARKTARQAKGIARG